MNHEVSGEGSEETSGAVELPYLRFYHSEALRTKTLSVLDALETAADATRHRAALADLVLELTEIGLAYYFVKPVQDANAGFMTEQTTKLGISGILRVMGPVARRVIGGMGAPQLLTVSSHIRHLMR
jgi:hypothetical protein